MSVTSESADGGLPAGEFSAWLVEIREAIRGERDADVPCGGCTACCTAAQFVHIGPDESDTLHHIPRELLFPAPRMPRGHMLLGYDERGHCPMLVDDRCSIYEHRPRTCRTYDCRVFAATGIPNDDDGKELIEHRARRWRFSYPTQRDLDQHAEVRAAADSLTRQPDALPVQLRTTTATQRAVLAIQLHEPGLPAEPTQ